MPSPADRGFNFWFWKGELQVARHVEIGKTFHMLGDDGDGISMVFFPKLIEMICFCLLIGDNLQKQGSNFVKHKLSVFNNAYQVIDMHRSLVFPCQ